MDIVVVNSGSSSLKMSYFSGTAETLQKEPIWQLEEDVDWDDEDERVIEKKMADALNKLLSADAKVQIKSKDDAFTVGHRIVHGGSEYLRSVKVDDKVLHDLEKLNDLAPLHNPINLRALKLARKLMPKATHVAAFDTAFHATIPLESAIYPGPYAWFEEWKVKRYGFHGLSHKYCASFAVRNFEKSEKYRKDAKSKIAISCHLGGGCSIAVLKDGISLDTTMGFTPLEGLMMRSRSGNIDPGLLIYLLKSKKYSLDELDHALNKESGLKGIFEKSGDMREIEKAMNGGDKRAKLAFDMFVDRIVSTIGGYAAKYGGMDMLIFTGGIGAHSHTVRSAVCKRLAILGVQLDEQLDENEEKLEIDCSSSEAQRVSIFHFAAREDYQIALDCVELLGTNKA